MNESIHDSSVLKKLLNDNQEVDRFHIDRLLNNTDKIDRKDLENVINENLTDKKEQNKQSSYSSEQHTQSNRLSLNQTQRSHKLELTKHHIIMIILNIFMFLALLFVFRFVPKLSASKFKNVQEEILLIKTGNIFGGTGGNEPLDDAHEAQLTFQDVLTSVTVNLSWDLDDRPLLFSLLFHYSNNKKGSKYGGEKAEKLVKTEQPWILAENEYIDQITVYEDRRKISNPFVRDGITHIIVGIEFKTNQNTRFFGDKGNQSTTEFHPGYFLGYARGKAGGFIDRLQFTWYKYCQKKSQIDE